MINNTAFKAFAIAQGFDVSYNYQSSFYSSKATRIAFYQFEALQEKI